MCCFSQPVASVANTRIFARAGDGANQILVYSMRLAAPTELAMVLPLPVPARAPDDAVRFIDLSGYPTLFDDMDRAFPVAVAASPSRGGPVSGSAPAPRLVVHSVGSFEASFVPSGSDFSRLDPRFRLPAQVWDAMPAYADFGFAVFKLSASATAADVHPMAFEFPRRDPGSLFFPTVHVHDGRVHATARFDHSLYLQVDPTRRFGNRTWQSSDGLLGAHVEAARAENVIDPTAVAYRLQIEGDAANRDIIVPLPIR